jgi:cytochrome b6-f complex iron-sulfur subunit
MSDEQILITPCRGSCVRGGEYDGIGRRTFLVQSALLAAVAALEACGVAGGGFATAPTLSSSATIKVSDYPTLSTVGGIAMVTVSGAAMAIVRTGPSSFVALSRVCPHQGGTIQQSGNGFQCPQHGAMFNSTGQWVGGQPTTNLHSYATSYDGTTGVLTIS